MIGKLIQEAKNLIKKGIIDIFFSSVYNELIMFLVSVFIIRLFSKDEYGSYAIAYNIYSYIAVFIGFGLTNAVLQYCSENRKVEEKEAIYKFCLKMGTSVNICFFLMMPIISSCFLNGEAQNIFRFMSGWPIIVYLSNYYLMRLRVKKDNRHFMIVNVVSSSAFIIFAGVLSVRFGIDGYIGSLYIKHSLSAFLGRKFAEGTDTCKSSYVLASPLKKEILKYSIICCLTNFASTIMMLLDVTCINYYFANASIVATYKTATQIPVALLFIPSSIIVFAYPYLAENNTNYIWLKRMSRKILGAVFLINLCIASFTFLLAPTIVKILWGSKYMDAVTVLRILLINFIVTGSFNMVYGNLMVAVKKVNVNLAKTIACSLLNIVLNILLLGKLGSTGAAIATLTVSIVSSAFSALYFSIWINKRTKKYLS